MFRPLMHAVFLATACGLAQSQAAPPPWPEPARDSKPWTRWWWLGSAVDAENLTRELEAFAAAGIGGVEICPIYGTRGAEDRDLEFLSPEWVEALAHVTREAERLGLGVDMTTGTGWPFGGPQVENDDASASLETWLADARDGGRTLRFELPRGELLLVQARNGDEVIDLTAEVDGRQLAWNAPPGEWTLMGLLTRRGIQDVKRAAPGGVGKVLDPFSPAALERYLAGFDRALADLDAPEPRAHFHDSFEYYGAGWTDGLPEAFERAHGYRLADELPALLGRGETERVARVRADYRVTMGDLHRDYLATWNGWAKSRGSLTRNQAHGSPGNLLDHYAVADIPETEIFREVADEQLPMLAFPAAMARLGGRNLASAEAFTWLDEHFRVEPATLKDAADFLFLGGVNHLFFHGIPYSPDDAAWPGWLFYASTHLGPQGGLWRDMEAFTGYLGRCQALLQDGRASSDVLLYLPVHDIFHRAEGLLSLFTIHNQNEWLHPLPFHRTAMDLWRSGHTADAISDALLEGAVVRDGKIVVGGHGHAALVIPDARHLPLETMERLLAIARDGGTIVIENAPPHDVPGWGRLDERRAAFAEMRRELDEMIASGQVRLASRGVPAELERLGLRRETMTSQGLRFVRREHPEGYHYFITNRGEHPVDGVVPLARAFASAEALDPMRPQRRGILRREQSRAGAGVRLALAPGESVLLRTFRERELGGPPYPLWRPAAPPRTLAGHWNLSFGEGGPARPDEAALPALGSWTTLADPRARDFSGTATYSLTFEHQGPVERQVLDLGRVAGTARLRLNGEEIGISWAPPHRFDVSASLREGRNELAVEVTNLAANRIAALDREGVDWKIFHEINFVDIDYRPFDASRWTPLDSGLLGPVTLVATDG